MRLLNHDAEVVVRPRLHREQVTEGRGYVVRTDAVVTGEIVLPDGGTTDDEVVLGNALVRRFHVENAVDDGGTILTAFSGSRSNRKAGAALFDFEREEYLPAVTNRYKGFYGHGDVLLVDRLTIEPIVRGHRLGLVLLDRVIRELSNGCDLVILKPFPLQFESDARDKAEWTRLALAAYSQTRENAFAALQDYYARLGFERVGHGDYFALAADNYTAHPRPELHLPARLPVRACALAAWLRLSSQSSLLQLFQTADVSVPDSATESKSSGPPHRFLDRGRTVELDQSLVLLM